jgi:hypothetical protein
MSGVAILAVLLAPFVLGALLLWHLRGVHGRMLATWQEVAARRGLELTPPRTLLFAVVGHPSMRGMVGGVRVSVQVEKVGAAGDKRLYTKVNAPAPIQSRVRVTTEGILASVGKLLGGADMSLADAVFDERFVVKADDEADASKLLNDRVRRALLDLDQVLDHHSRAARSSLQLTALASILDVRWRGVADGAAVLEAAIDLVVAAAGSRAAPPLGSVARPPQA